MQKKEFLKQYILTRTSYKRNINDLYLEAIAAWTLIDTTPD
jgi:hypothetical protein